jgi:hypothetical protein
MDTPPPPSSSPSPSRIADDVKAEAKGFVGSILDFTFSSFVTPKIIKLFYFLMLAGVALGSTVFLVANLFRGGSAVLVGLIGAPIMLILGAVLARVYVEIIMLAFKVLETLQKIESKQK